MALLFPCPFNGSRGSFLTQDWPNTILTRVYTNTFSSVENGRLVRKHIVHRVPQSFVICVSLS